MARAISAEAGILAGIDVFELAAVGMVVTDRAGRFRRVNPVFAKLLGRSVAELEGASFSSLTSADDVNQSLTVMRELLARTTDTARFEKRYYRPDGSVVWVDLSIQSLIGPDGEVVCFLAQGSDVTGRKLAEEALETQCRRLAEAQHMAGLGSFEFDPANPSVVCVSDEQCRILGLPAATVMDVALLMKVVHPDDRELVNAAMRRCCDNHTPVDIVHRLLLADGALRWVHVRAAWVTDDRDVRGRLVGSALDITDRKHAEDALQYQAFHDALTGLANRALFLDRVDHALHRADRTAAPVAVLFLDLDDFKTVNDSLGHRVGDQLLVAVAQRVASVARAGDTVARLGGDEFALLLESGEMPDTAQDVAERIATTLRAPFLLDATEVTVGLSIGIAVGQPPDVSADLLRDADLAMYMAKRNGKGRFEMARPGMQIEALQRLATINDLRFALDHDELEVFYQPIVDVPEAMPAGAEALVRWHHPRRGLVGPAEFVKVAESAGLIVPLGTWVLNQACRQTQAWRVAGVVGDAFYISVNLSPRQLADPTLIETVERALRDSGLPPSALVLEITESTLMVDFDSSLARLQSLSELGLRLALDDYGTGYSSLSRLGRLPINIVKIDKSFVDQITENSEGRALVQSVIDVTRALGIHSIAEGVEQQDQRLALEQMECSFIQGYLYAHPMPARQAADTLRQLSTRRQSGEANLGGSAWSTPLSR